MHTRCTMDGNDSNHHHRHRHRGCVQVKPGSALKTFGRVPLSIASGSHAIVDRLGMDRSKKSEWLAHDEVTMHDASIFLLFRGARLAR
jgi:hypothetical protein